MRREYVLWFIPSYCPTCDGVLPAGRSDLWDQIVRGPASKPLVFREVFGNDHVIGPTGDVHCPGARTSDGWCGVFEDALAPLLEGEA